MEPIRSIAARKGEERRRWERIPVAVPVFVRGKDADGKEFSEFTTALNIGGGGLLLAIRRYIPLASIVDLEIPAGPMPKGKVPRKFIRDLSGRAVTVTHSEQCYPAGVKFSHPLVQPTTKKSTSKKS